MDKKADLGDWLIPALIAFLLGAAAMYFAARGVIPLPIAVCPA